MDIKINVERKLFEYKNFDDYNEKENKNFQSKFKEFDVLKRQTITVDQNGVVCWDFYTYIDAVYPIEVYLLKGISNYESKS